MGEVDTILQNAILNVAGTEGLAKFNKAGYNLAEQKIVYPDGSLDLPRLMNLLLDLFQEEQSSAIADNVLARYMGPAGDGHKPPQAMAEETHAATAEAVEPEGGMSYEDNLAKYLETEASDVRDLINEARRIRMAMGKYSTPKSAIHEEAAGYHEHAAPEAHIAVPIEAHAAPIEAHAPPAHQVPPKKAAHAAEIPGTIEAEIRTFVEAGKSYTSVDIMDFIRYLKDKGYHFQENIVLEKVYTWLEERKGRERAVLMVDIQGFILRTPWPSENEVSIYIDRKREEGIVCESTEIKRMILMEMIRKH